jgi:exopolysaccharide biosynthesis protein
MKAQIKIIINYSLLIINSIGATGQLKWRNVDSLYQPLPSSVHVYKTTDSLDGKPNIAYYVIADLKDKKLLFEADTTLNRRFTPTQFYKKNAQPFVVVNCTFFSFETNRSLNTVIKNGKTVSYNQRYVKGKGKDSAFEYVRCRSAIGINSKRQPDIVWIDYDSFDVYPFANNLPKKPFIRGIDLFELSESKPYYDSIKLYLGDQKNQRIVMPQWKVETAVGGGPVLLQNGKIFITNEEEMMFTGKAINDKHPRTAMGYTKDNNLIILVVQGRFPGIAEGATLGQEAKILQDIGCREALNLDGGGSSCMLVNGKETIKPSDATGQRAVPAVFIIRRK